MAAAIPPALKAADIARFAQRAGQLEKARPAIAYWCNYWIVDQIISKGLHQADDDSKSYTMQMMDKLEQAKADFSENDAIVDDMAGHAYLEQFAQETFQRADNAMKANKVSRQTADTFQAAATFLELGQIWGPLDSETTSKIKFAKYHALRIAKAIRAGEDPNASNPIPEPSPVVEAPHLDRDDADAQVLDSGITDAAMKQPSVEDVPDDHSLHTAKDAPALSPPDENYYHTSAAPEVSPLEPSSGEQKLSDGGGYFPRVPQDVGRPQQRFSPDAGLPTSNSTFQQDRSRPDVLPPDSNASSLPSAPPPAVDGQQNASAAAHASTFQPSVPPNVQPGPGLGDSFASRRGVVRPQVIDQLKDDEVSVATAQKHAKFAISALNFEDVNTAVKELREALEVLGAS